MFFFQFFNTLEYSPTPSKLLEHYIWLVSKISQNWLTWRHLNSDNGCQNSGEHYKIRHFHRPDFPKSHNSVSKPHHVKKSFSWGVQMVKYTSVRHLAIGETEDLKCGATTRGWWRRNVDGVTRAKQRRLKTRWSSAWAFEHKVFSRWQFVAWSNKPSTNNCLCTLVH